MWVESSALELLERQILQPIVAYTRPKSAGAPAILPADGDLHLNAFLEARFLVIGNAEVVVHEGRSIRLRRRGLEEACRHARCRRGATMRRPP
jgi:hypothetical protein